MKKLLLTVICLINSLLVFSQMNNTKKQTVEAQMKYNLAIEEIQKEQYINADKFLDEAIQLKQSFIEALLLSVRVNIELGNNNKAITKLTEVSENQPDNGEAWYLKGFLAFNTDTVFTDSSIFHKALELNYKEAPVYYYLASTYFNRKNYDKALEHYTKALELKKDYALAYHDRGTVHTINVNYEAAIMDYRNAVFFKPDFVMAYCNLAAAREKSGDFNGAIAEYNSAINIDTTNYLAYNNRAVIKIELGNEEEAAMDIKKALNHNPTYTPALINLAYIEFKNDNVDTAIELLNNVVNNDSTNAIAILNRGLAYETQGKIAEACADWEIASFLGQSEALQYLKDCE